MSRLWYHEVMRVYADRLISETEVNRCRDIIVNIGKSYVNMYTYDKLNACTYKYVVIYLCKSEFIMHIQVRGIWRIVQKTSMQNHVYSLIFMKQRVIKI
jgi:hypothetical protein